MVMCPTNELKFLRPDQPQMHQNVCYNVSHNPLACLIFNGKFDKTRIFEGKENWALANRWR